ncbi:MAG: GNAT family N-acetyltransferase [Pirellulaceae bacterium]
MTYFKRYRMEISLKGCLFQPPRLSDRYMLIPWSDEVLDAHAEAKFHSFCFEIDANVFPCLGDREGCLRLMREITRREGFLTNATWLLAVRDVQGRYVDYCGTVQGVRDSKHYGAIQNLGITPTHRGKGLGTALLHRALCGFREVGLPRAYLEVTAQNSAAIRLYHRLGFRRIKTVYKAVEVAYA